MMERSREARRGTMEASFNGGGMSRRRQQRTNTTSSSLRDSPEDDVGAMELQETSTGRLRDRKKERDRERSGGRSGSAKRRRPGEKILHVSSREDLEDSSEESVDDDDEDEPPTGVMRFPTPNTSSSHPPLSGPISSASSLGVNPSSGSSSLPPPNNRHRKNLPSKNVRLPSLWRVTDDMVVPRKARSVSTSRRIAAESHECWDSGAGAGGGGGSSGVSGSGEQIPNTHHRQTSSSPTRNNPAQAPASTTTPISLRKKTLKPISGGKHHRLPKVAKSPSSVQDIEFEVAEVLYGMTRQQFQSPPKLPPPQQPDTHKSDTKDYTTTTTAARVSLSPPHHSNTSNVLVPKRKRPRPVSNSSEEGIRSKMEHECSPKLEKNSVTNTLESDDTHPKKESTKPERTLAPAVPVVADADSKKNKEVTIKKCSEVVEASPKKPHQGEKLKIDLMAAPHAVKSSLLADDILMESNSDDMGKTTAIAKMEEERRPDKGPKLESMESHGESTKMTMTVDKFDNNNNNNTCLQDFKSKERTLDLQLDLEKPHLEAAHNQQMSKLPKMEKGQQPTVPLQMGVAGWSGGLPPLGYMGQMPPSLPPAFSLDGSSNGSSKAVQLPPQFPSQQLRLKRCATHNYIAKNIYYHQQIARIGPMWAATAAPPPPVGGIPLLGAKPPPPYNLNAVPPSEFIGFPGRSLGLMPDKPGQAMKDSKTTAGNNFQEAQQQRKPHGIPQPSQGPSSSSSNMMPALIFPINHQQQAAGSRSVAKAPVLGPCNTATPSNSSSTATMPSGTAVTTSMNLPANEAQYLAILQNNGYSFPIPTQVGAAPPQYRGSHGQPMPFFNGPFYASQMLHHPLQQQQPHAQAGGPQNMSNSSGSLPSSQKQQQHAQRVVPAGSATGGLPPTSKPRPQQQQQHMPHHLAWQLNGEAAGDETPSSAESRGLQQHHHVQKGGGGIYGPNFTVPFHPQDYANMMSHVAAASGSGGGDKHHLSTSQPQNMKIDPTQSPEFAMSFAAFNGASAASGVPPPGIDFSAAAHAQNHLFQSTSEAARYSTRHSYQMAAAAGSSQHKKNNHTEDGKSGDSTVQGDDERKIASIAKPPGGGFSHQHSLTFSRSDDPPPAVAIMNNSAVGGDSSRTLNLIPSAASTASSNGYRPSVTSVASSTNANNFNLQQQQHMLQLQRIRKQQQQQPLPRSKSISSNAGVYSDRPPSGSVATKFPNSSMAAHFTPVATTQVSSQWKSSSAQPQPTIVAKNHVVVQQQGRQPSQQLPGHQMQISFTSNPQKPPPSNPSTASAINSITGSHQASSASKASAGGGGGSPRSTSGGSKPGVGSSASSTLPLQQQQQSNKGSPSGTTRKSSSPVSNRNIPSILGNPHMASSGSKNQQPLLPPHPHQQQHPFSQPYVLFSNPAYLQQVQNPQANTMAAGYYQRWPLEQQQQQPISTSGSNATSDPAKAVAAAAAAAAASANSMKGPQPQSLMQSAQLVAAAGGQPGSHPLMSGFPYIQAVPSMPPVKPVDQKAPSGNDSNNVQACWQPEKR